MPKQVQQLEAQRATNMADVFVSYLRKDIDSLNACTMPWNSDIYWFYQPPRVFAELEVDGSWNWWILLCLIWVISSILVVRFVF